MPRAQDTLWDLKNVLISFNNHEKNEYYNNEFITVEEFLPHSIDQETKA